MKRGIRGHDVSEKGLAGICKKCGEYNIDYLQLVLEKSVEGFEFGKFSDEYAEAIKKELGNIRIAVLGSYINPSNPVLSELSGDIAKFREKIMYASILKPIAVGTETGIYKEGETDTEEAYECVLETFKELVAEAEKCGVNIGVEGVHCFVINTPGKMKRLIDDLDSENVKVIFDPVNLLNAENYHRQDEIIEEAFSLLANRICVIHAKDFTVADGTFRSARPTEGDLNYELIFKKLKEYDLDIPIICEEIDEKSAAIAFCKMEGFLLD